MPNMKLIIAIINYLKSEAKKEAKNPDTQESLEVAVQCLQTAYDLDPKDSRLLKNELPLSLEDIFISALPSLEDEIEDGEAAAASGHTVNKAEIMKNLGNNLMRKNVFSEAVRYYTAAIEIDGKNAVYYCNRAAAYSKLNDFQNAIKDCEKAVEIDPKYAKAYGRMGLAHSSLEQNDLALKAFKKAVEIDPLNDSYVNNLKLAIDKMEKPANPVGGLPGISSIDWHTLFNNPAFRNMASTIMQDPNIISALSAGMSGSMNPGAAPTFPPPENPGTTPSASAAPGASAAAAGGNRSLDMLLEAGQYLAAQMQAANPDLVEQFRQSTRNVNPSNQDKRDSSTQ